MSLRFRLLGSSSYGDRLAGGGHDVFLVRVGPELGRDPAAVEHDDAMGDAEALLDLGGGVDHCQPLPVVLGEQRSEEHTLTSSHVASSYAVFILKKECMIASDIR